MDNSKAQRSKYPKMKAFDNTQAIFAVLGIGPNLATQAYPFNLKLFTGILALAIGTTSVLLYAFKEAKTLSEYTQSMYFCSLVALIMFVLQTLALKVKTTYEYISGVNEVINTSKWTFNYLYPLQSSARI